MPGCEGDLVVFNRWIGRRGPAKIRRSAAAAVYTALLLMVGLGSTGVINVDTIVWVCALLVPVQWLLGRAHKVAVHLARLEDGHARVYLSGGRRKES